MIPSMDVPITYLSNIYKAPVKSLRATILGFERVPRDSKRFQGGLEEVSMGS